MSEYWTAATIANNIHRMTFAALGFARRGRVCERTDGGLQRTLTFITSRAGKPRIEMLAQVAVTGLPPRTTRHRCDSLWGNVRTTAGDRSYPLPCSNVALPSNLLDDAAGPVAHFLLRSADLGDFVLWAQEIFLGDDHAGCWGSFRPVFPQGTGPLQAASFAAAMQFDTELTEFLTARVENEEPSEHRFNDFLGEIQQLQPQLHQRHPIERPMRF